MRHDLVTGAVATGPGRMGKASAAATLVASAGFALVLAARYACALDSAIALSAVAMATDKNLCAAARAQEHTARSLHRRSP
ncbi:hypothetical protein FHX59_007067 [Paraburkholderia silvatlantica]|uniref:Uncharacterized protein n=1 Tax=Paraburkholderia silvatlantica TaxID=321895 RepID=A0ABR6FZR5_9BURK|nr:hypothetical protein [Paraburkholderia silvatlantica]PVY22265.1 hypothetical protein C7411_13358 [Paraburkholderia silvatlantica]PXW27072.1 hypothetical protein C7413_13458 [Paraburkholderia silvatlantica]